MTLITVYIVMCLYKDMEDEDSRALELPRLYGDYIAPVFFDYDEAREYYPHHPILPVPISSIGDLELTTEN